MKLHPFVAACALAFGGYAIAAQLPQPMRFDPRVREVIYNPDDIVRIQSAYGVLTKITFAPDEVIKHTALGDSLAWEIAPVDSHLFIKPTEPNAYTNMSVITNKRSYQFELATVPRSKAQVFYKVQFAYPDAEAAKIAEQQRIVRQAEDFALAEIKKQQKAAADRARLDNAMHDAEVPVRNGINYHYKGSSDVTPDEAYDDGTFTYFRFRGNREFPVVYLKDEQGKESLVNTTVKGDTIVVQRIAARYVMRKDNAVAEIVNPNYDRIGTSTGTGTITTAVTRTVKGEDDPLPEVLPTQPPAVKTVVPVERVEPTRTVPSEPEPMQVAPPRVSQRPMKVVPVIAQPETTEPPCQEEIVRVPSKGLTFQCVPQKAAASPLEAVPPAAAAEVPATELSAVPAPTSDVAPAPTPPAIQQPTQAAIVPQEVHEANILPPLRDGEYIGLHIAKLGNLRGAPRLDASKVGSVLPKMVCKAIGRDPTGEWFAVENGRYMGWVNTSLVEPMAQAHFSRLPILHIEQERRVPPYRAVKNRRVADTTNTATRARAETAYAPLPHAPYIPFNDAEVGP